MGSPAPYFQILPVPSGGLPTNAPILATHSYAWSVRVLDGATELPTSEDFKNLFGSHGGVVVVRPRGAWPARRELAVVATMTNAPTSVVRSSVTTAAGPMTTAPRCAWTGPIPPQPRGPELPDGMWPTNIPRPPRNQWSFTLPAIDSDGGYLVVARVRFTDGGRRFWIEGALEPGATIAVAIAPPHPHDDVSDDARIVGLVLEDMAGNAASYGDTTG